MDMMDDELEVLQKRLLQKQLTGALQEAPEDSFQQVAPILGGAVDILSRAGIQSADPVEIMTGIKIPRAEPTQVEKSVRAIMADRATKTRQKALDEMTLLKSLDERRRRQMEMGLKAQDAASRLALEYDKLASTEGRAAADRALKQALMEQEQKFKTGERIGGESFKKGESQLDRELRLKLGKMQAAAKAQKSEKPPTTEEKKAGGFARRLEQSIQTFDNLAEQGVTFQGMKYQLQRSLPEKLSGMKDRNLLLQEQAERNFINALLRRESGASISTAEFENAEIQYFPRPNDTPEVLLQKKANRKQAFENLKAEAGNAYYMTPLVSYPKIDANNKLLKQAKPKTVTQGGHTYILNEKTGQYE